MSGTVGGVPLRELRAWLAARSAEPGDPFARGYQGHVHLFEGHGRRLVVKTASGRGLARLVRQRMIRKEDRVYRRLADLPGVPACHGLVDGRHLVLEYVEGVPYRGARIDDPERFFERLLALIRSLHDRGVAHGDLKKKDNLLVVDRTDPCIVDFGVAVVRRQGFAPLNHYGWELARRFDYNAWAKLKHGGDLSAAPEEDRRLARRTLVERVSRGLKSAWIGLRRALGA